MIGACVRLWKRAKWHTTFGGVRFGVVALLFYDIVIQALACGETISHYLVVDTLGEGGMGVVYKA